MSYTYTDSDWKMSYTYTDSLLNDENIMIDLVYVDNIQYIDNNNKLIIEEHIKQLHDL